MKFFGHRVVMSAVRGFSTRGTWQEKTTVDVRDWVQSSMKGWPGITPNMMKYFRTVNDLFHTGEDTTIKSLVAFGGTWYQLPAMHDNNPFDLWRAVVSATRAEPGKEALPLELLQRSSHQFGLEEVNQDVIRETYRKLAEIAGPDRQIIIRLFHFNNRYMHNESTYQAIEQLRSEGIKNFVISAEHSYAIFMKNEEVAEGIVRGLLRNVSLTSGDVDYPIQGGIKDFSGSLAPEDAENILRRTDRRIKEEADRLESSVDAERLRKAMVTLHSHLTDRSEHTVSAFRRVGKGLGRDIATHGIHKVDNATHHVIKDDGLTKAQVVLQRQAEELLAKLVREHGALIVKDYEAGKPRPWTGFAGGGTPMIHQFVSGISKLYKLTLEEAEALFYRHMEDVRDRNNIPTVTPAQKGVADLALLRIANEKAGRRLYEGTFSSEAIDVVRNLYPDMVKDKDMLEGAFRQYRDVVLTRYEKKNDISVMFKTALQAVGMNSDRSSLDKDTTQEVIGDFAAKGEKLHPLVQDEIIEACGAATRPTRLPDQMAYARKVVAELKARHAVKVPEDEAVLLIASLRGRGIGQTLVEHHGNKLQFPALGVTMQQPSIGLNVAELWKNNVAGEVLEDVMDSPSYFK